LEVYPFWELTSNSAEPLGHIAKEPSTWCMGHKIAGIAQAIRAGFALVSGMLLVRQDPHKTTEVLQEFYERAGSPLRLNPDAVTALNRLPHQSHLTVDQAHDALVAGHQALYSLEHEPLTQEEWSLAQQLYWERQLGAQDNEEVRYAGYH